uniref:Ricin B lectin domain-containing protein n=1 Tax=Kwoniella bestiolae CBS 10118 TaxID=1296100 RepID=A0A1B9FTC6_9TREE|nr:hypothetical protein I302_08808 [Kwoniella bestiolae CBS 10118]OCF22027.1 hypothetical protein I302_08808 [Kwoniella bestiolae CBS 10118]
MFTGVQLKLKGVDRCLTAQPLNEARPETLQALITECQGASHWQFNHDHVPGNIELVDTNLPGKILYYSDFGSNFFLTDPVENRESQKWTHGEDGSICNSEGSCLTGVLGKTDQGVLESAPRDVIGPLLTDSVIQVWETL